MIKETDLAGALQRIADGSDQVCMLVPIGMKTTVEELIKAKNYAIITQQASEKKGDPKPKTEKKKNAKPKKELTVDVGKILALHKAGWNISSICLETGDSYYTVKKIIDQEMEKEEPDAQME